MAKKTKRQTSKNGAPASVVSSTVAPSAPRVSVARSTEVEFKPDYSYVMRDLKRIGVLAGSFFLVLVALSFFLR